MKTSSILLALALVGVLGSGCSTSSAPVDDIAAPGALLTEPPVRTTPEGGDVSETVEQLKALNNLPSSALQTGQRIVVPLA